MLYFSGDIHGSPWGVKRFCEKQKLTKEDTLILLGDVGANYFGDWRDDEMKKVLATLVPTILCIHGNHEMRPWHIDGSKYPTVEALLERADGDYPNGGKKEGIVVRPTEPIFCPLISTSLYMKIVSNKYLLKNE